MPDWSKLPEFQAADDAWAVELALQFGKKAGDVRYTEAGRGQPGSRLRALYEAREAARIACIDRLPGRKPVDPVRVLVWGGVGLVGVAMWLLIVWLVSDRLIGLI